LVCVQARRSGGKVGTVAAHESVGQCGLIHAGGGLGGPGWIGFVWLSPDLDEELIDVLRLQVVIQLSLVLRGGLRRECRICEPRGIVW